jgi:diguanylate cyclase
MHTFTQQDFIDAFQTKAITHHFQPIVELGARHVVGYEALARWQHPVHGLLSSSQFIYQLVAMGFSVQLTQVALNLSVKFFLEAQRCDRVSVPIAINLTAVEFEDEALIERLDTVVPAEMLASKLLKFEMLEWAAANSIEVVAQRVAQLKAKGIDVYADDFGHAYGSFHRLLNVPYQGIKLDSEYANALSKQAAAHAIVDSLVKLTDDLNLQFVVEGVQTLAQESILKSLGVTQAQGFLYYKPLVFEEAMQLLALKTTVLNA